MGWDGGGELIRVGALFGAVADVGPRGPPGRSGSQGDRPRYPESLRPLRIAGDRVGKTTRLEFLPLEKHIKLED